MVDGWSDGAGVSVDGGSGTVLFGDRIGTNAAGTAADGNQTGVAVNAGLVTLGGHGRHLAGKLQRRLRPHLEQRRCWGVPSPMRTSRSRATTSAADLSGRAAIPNLRGIAGGLGGGLHPGAVTIGGATSAPGVAPGNVISGNTTRDIQIWAAASLHDRRQPRPRPRASGTRALQPRPGPGVPQEGISVFLDKNVMIGGSSSADERRDQRLRRRWRLPGRAEREPRRDSGRQPRRSRHRHQRHTRGPQRLLRRLRRRLGHRQPRLRQHKLRHPRSTSRSPATGSGRTPPATRRSRTGSASTARSRSAACARPAR